MIELREHQKKILNNATIVDILLWISGKQQKPDIVSPIVVSPTGSGKTVMFSAVAHWCYHKNLRVLILTHRKEILKQTIKKIAKYGIPSGQIISGKPTTKDYIQVASIQTLARKTQAIKKPDIIIIDECHHATLKNQIGQILQFFNEVPRVGYTATPQRLDGIGLGDVFDHLILGETIQYLVDQGWLAYPKMYKAQKMINAQYHVTRGDFDAQEQFDVMSTKTIIGDVILNYKKYLDGMPTIVSCVSVAHAKLMAQEFCDAGYFARAVWGDMSDTDRTTALEGLGNGTVQVITFDSLIGEGVDIPAVVGVIMLRKTRSLTFYLQVVGRSLRPMFEPNAKLDTIDDRLNAQKNYIKPHAIILDHVGNFEIHGHVLADRQWPLETTKKQKAAVLPTTTTCPVCFGIWAGIIKVCPECKYSFVEKEKEKKQIEIKKIQGELVEAHIHENEIHDLTKFVQTALDATEQNRKKMMLAKAYQLKDRQKIQALAKAVGYNEKWSIGAWNYITTGKWGFTK